MARKLNRDRITPGVPFDFGIQAADQHRSHPSPSVGARGSTNRPTCSEGRRTPVDSIRRPTPARSSPRSARHRSPALSSTGARGPTGPGDPRSDSPPSARPPPSPPGRGSSRPPRRRAGRPGPAVGRQRQPGSAQPGPRRPRAPAEAGPRQVRRVPRRVGDVGHPLGPLESPAGRVPDPLGPFARHAQRPGAGPSRPSGLVPAAVAGLLGRLDRRDHRADRRPGGLGSLVVGRRAGPGPVPAGEGGQLQVAPSRLDVDLAGIDLPLPAPLGPGEEVGRLQPPGFAKIERQTREEHCAREPLLVGQGKPCFTKNHSKVNPWAR